MMLPGRVLLIANKADLPLIFMQKYFFVLHVNQLCFPPSTMRPPGLIPGGARVSFITKTLFYEEERLFVFSVNDFDGVLGSV